MITLSIKKISCHLIWIFGLLEMITVPLVAWLPQISSLQTKSPWQGAVVGFLGIIVLFFILNSAIPRLHIKINNETLMKISVLPAALWNTFLLALIFGIQKITGMLSIEPWIPRYLLAGFVSVFGAVLITFSLYRPVSQALSFLKLSVKTTQHLYTIRKISVLVPALLAGIYEAIALPVILLWQKAESNVPVMAAITGLAGGVIGCSLVLCLFNHMKFIYFTITMEKTILKSKTDFF